MASKRVLGRKKQQRREHELRSRLEEGLSGRGVCVVYFEADDNCLYMDAVYAIATIQCLGAKMIWITPKTREEWKSQAPTPSTKQVAYHRDSSCSLVHLY